MNILIIRPRLETGGASRSILLLSEGLAGAGHRPVIATHSGEGVEAASRLNLKLYLLSLYPTSVFTCIRSVVALLKIVRQEKIDLIHSHHRFSHGVSKLVSWFSGVPVVSTVHEFKNDQRWVTRWSLGQRIITFSHSIKVHLISHYGVPAHKISVVSIGIKTDLPSPEAVASTRDRLKLQAGWTAIGCISRLSAEKGLDLLFEAMSLKKKRGVIGCTVLWWGMAPNGWSLKL
jgi:glycosyltransferase involved in cell wall biosynthesis